MGHLKGELPRWLGVAAATAAASLAMGAAGVPSSTLFAALAVGLAYALTLAHRRPLAVPHWGLLTAQALLGVALGTQFEAGTLSTIAANWVPIALVTAGTVASSLIAGLVFALATGVDRSTSLLGLVAGGASAIVAMSDELGADARLVAFMQYLRVLVVVITAPLVAQLLLADSALGAAPVTSGLPTSQGAGLPADLAFTAGCALAGGVLGRWLRITAGALLVPLSLVAALTIAGISGDAQVPLLLQSLAFAGIGLHVGLRFTVATVRRAGHLLPAVLLAIAGIVVACAGLAVALLPLTDISLADAYLATTPGGLYAVAAVAVTAGGNATFVVSVQALRLFGMVLAAPPLVRRLHRSGRRDAQDERNGARPPEGGRAPRSG